MEYELAEKLKKAGFPYTIINCVRHDIDDWKSPTLLELVEECCKDSLRLTRAGNGWRADAGNNAIVEVGRSPEEAVAKLWLTLQEQ